MVFYILQNVKYHLGTKTRHKTEYVRQKTGDRRKKMDKPTGNKRLIAIRNTTSDE